MSDACPTHCCPRHGCKYSYANKDCPVAAGEVEPVYPNNNGCEVCEDEPQTFREWRVIWKQTSGGGYHWPEAVFSEEIWGAEQAEADARHILANVEGDKGNVLNEEARLQVRDVTAWKDVQ